MDPYALMCCYCLHMCIGQCPPTLATLRCHRRKAMLFIIYFLSIKAHKSLMKLDWPPYTNRTIRRHHSNNHTLLALIPINASNVRHFFGTYNKMMTDCSYLLAEKRHFNSKIKVNIMRCFHGNKMRWLVSKICILK